MSPEPEQGREARHVSHKLSHEEGERFHLSLLPPFGVQMEDLVHDLPLPVDFEQREQVRVSVTGQVLEFEPGGGDRANDVDAGDPRLECRRRAVLVVPGEKLLDRAGEQVVTGITENGRLAGCSAAYRPSGGRPW